MTKRKPIKASLGFKKRSDGDVVARANAVLGGLYAAKDDFATPPVDQATLKTQIDALSASMAAALDGGKKAIAEREHQKEVVIKSLRQLGHYAEENCKDDMMTFLKSGFQAAFTSRASAQPLSDWIRKIVPGKNSGQMLVSIIARPDALSYQLRWASGRDARKLDRATGRQDQTGDTGERVDPRHDLCVSGSCRHQLRLHRLE
jgi:hypothetical protein